MRFQRIRFGVTAVATAAALAAAPLTAGVAQAAPAPVSTTMDGRVTEIEVYSAAMDRNVPVSVITPANTERPSGVVYLLNGAGGGEDSANWINKTDILDFARNKNAYIVIPNAGEFSYYTDWEKPDPKFGVYKWSTFLGEELPPVIDGAFNTTGRNVIGGISSSATSVFNLAIEHPGLYRGVASYSGCAGTSDPFGQETIRLVVETRGGGDATNMWGPYGGPGWRAHDPMINAAKLRGTPLYISTGTGLPGAYDTPKYVPDPKVLADQLLVGGVLEAGSLGCTVAFLDRLGRLDIPVTFDIVPTATHSWGYWEDQLHRSWPFYEKALRG